MKAGILGASGYTGSELLRLLAAHPRFEVAVATAHSHAGEAVAAHTPSLAAAYPGLIYEESDAARFDGLDLVFCGLPHGESQRIVPELKARAGLVVDLAADFRLKDATLYPQWYGEEHSAPELLADAVYGLPELFREGLAGATLVAAAGCYPTAAGLALAPLVRNALVEPTGIVVDAASGVSGAGRGLKETLHFGTVDEDFTAYGLLTHRHTPEMEQIIGGEVLFTPHLVPMTRGILATCYARPRAGTTPTTTSVTAALHDAYDAEPFVVVSDDPPSTKATAGSNAAHVTARRGPAHRVGDQSLRPRQPREGRIRSGRPVRQRRPRAARDHGVADRRGLPVSVNAPQGFVAVGGYAGIKAAKAHDVAVVATADGRAVPAAGVFTSNLAAAAPVQVSRAHLAATGGRAAGVILTSGNANAATGVPGREAAERLCTAVAGDIGAIAEEILICQTGLIGIPFPIDNVMPEIEPIVMARTGRPESAAEAAKAIMTTDTVPKEVVVAGDGFTVGGMAKGAAMLAPNMATMLALCTTDAAVDAATLQAALREAVAASFNTITVDGCTSTNDTVLVLANGLGARPSAAALTAALFETCRSLAEQMVDDAEGATKVAHVHVRGAVSDEAAHVAARQVADSMLVQCSLFGEDPYWGRIISELGSAGTPFDIDRVLLAYGSTVVCAGGVGVPHDAAAVAAHLAGRHVVLECDLGLGSGESVVLGTDLGYGYIDENRTTS